MSADQRQTELAENLAQVRERLAAAEQQRQVGTGPAELIAVTKFFPAADVRRLAQLGIVQVGENRDQEASAKAAEAPEVTWHFIGQLQSKKTNSVVRYASCVHSMDRLSLVTGLGKSVRRHRESVLAGEVARGPNAERDLQCLIQVSLDGTAGRGGVAPAELERLAEAVEAEDGLRLQGVMAVAPLGQDPDPAFQELFELSQVVRRTAPAAQWISAGMSADLEAAVRWGSTHVRVGSGILGARPVG
ncbi:MULTISPECIES: YggS family pyridoxal phosphate-dependent enzyme [Kocuria]|uniref:Pyridoxal phosphate homeostasis protein n=1 Tax=Kocuria subflava TaxID=1736139 RepID=A0A846TIA1_9MICC|nr:YggS family pyridoxal phosphate-dependent enzyme [Kocuria sp. CPCC 104605]NKE08888.1 YggS family pyridoxal phosphate-dependent enzyme [Kocuria subflava]